MSIKDWVAKRKADYQRGLEITLERRLERQKKKMEQMTPGTIQYGMMMKQKPLEVMRDAYELRKRKRLERFQKDKKI